MRNHESFDFVIIGGGLGGLIVSNALVKNGYKACIVDPNKSLGGDLRSGANETDFDRGFKLFFDSENTRDGLEFLGEILNSPISCSPVSVPPVTFEKGAFQPFVGFGKTAPKYIDEIEFYTRESRLQLSSSPRQWVEQLESSISEKAEIIEGDVTSMEIDGGRAKSCQINGTKTIHGDNFIFCAHPHQLETVLGKALPPKSIQKINRTSFWTAISIDFTHSHEVTKTQALHVLRGGTDDSVPCLGVFHPVEEGQKTQKSQWLVFVDRETSEEDERSGAAFREIKKQIKRAYPTALEGLAFERILFSQDSHGNINLKATERMTLPGIENFYLCSGRLSEEKNITGVLLRAKSVLEGLQLDWSQKSTQSPAISPTNDTELSPPV